MLVENVSDLGNFSFDMVYNPGIIGVTGTAVFLGGFPSSTGRTVSLIGPNINNNTGLLSTGANSTGAPQGPSGTGVIARVIFSTRNVNQVMTSNIDFQNVSLFTTSGVPIGSTSTGGSMTACYYADLDCNNVVNVVDIQVVAGRWNSTAGSPNYDPNSDIDLDGDIDIQDVQLVAGQWNRSAPFF